MTSRHRPRGVIRAVQRMPRVLFRLRLGGLLGPRLRLTTTGRATGRRRYTVLEIMERDAATGEYRVGAVWGPRSDWFLNLAAAPALEVIVGRRRFVPDHRILPAQEGAAVIERYRRRRPRWSAMAERTTGRALSTCTVPIVGLRPAD
jgi:deazaflavin-dependent oxidoreductase (nitroreductase family)